MSRADELGPRFVRAIPLLVATLALAMASPVPLAAPLLGLALLLAVVLGPRLPLDRPTQRLASLVLVVLVIAAVRALGLAARSDTHLGAFAFGLAVAPLAIAAFRVIVADVEWGHAPNALLAFVSVMACGGARVGKPYGVIVAAALASVVASLRVGDLHRAKGREVPRTAAPVAAIIVGLACALAVSLALVLRPIANFVEKRIERAFLDSMAARATFSDTMRLQREMTAKETRLLRSSRIVLRLRGPRVERLRGVVFDRYEGSRWVRQAAGAPKALAVRRLLEGADVLFVKEVGEATDRLFLPLSMSELAVASGTPIADAHGVVRINRESSDASYWVRTDGTSARKIAELAPFGPEDRELSAELAPPLNALASQWAQAAGAKAPHEALIAIEQRLQQDFDYSLESARKTHLDPVLDFLFMHRVGHCEYFASAMALMARSIGVPARVVAGYRVSEHNPYLGHYVVRDRNAHSWVEAWLPGRGWVTFDPTPVSGTFQREQEQEGATAVAEMFSAGAGLVEDWLAERTIAQLSVSAVLGLLVFALVRALGRKAPPPVEGPSPALAFSAPMPAFATFLEDLAAAGLVKGDTEPLEAFAARLPEELGALLLRYVDVRYGEKADAALPEALAAARPRR